MFCSRKTANSAPMTQRNWYRGYETVPAPLMWTKNDTWRIWKIENFSELMLFINDNNPFSMVQPLRQCQSTFCSVCRKISMLPPRTHVIVACWDAEQANAGQVRRGFVCGKGMPRICGYCVCWLTSCHEIVAWHVNAWMKYVCKIRWLKTLCWRQFPTPRRSVPRERTTSGILDALWNDPLTTISGDLTGSAVKFSSSNAMTGPS